MDLNIELLAEKAVSYTHLDVYKRQVVPVPAAQGKGTVFIKDSPNHQMAFTGTSHCDDMMSKTGRYLRYEKNTGSR